jgi:N-acetylmuramoyl-L-alanine amidase
VALTKGDDMWARRNIIDHSGADIVISIHMNKFSDSSVSGPMVFYFNESGEGEKLAAAIQQELNDTLQPPKPRSYRPETYYILRSGTCPCALVECGFISNEREEWLLGATQYLNTRFVTDITEDISQ